MARDGVFPRWFSTVHPAWRTPWVGTIISSVLALVVIILDVVLSTTVVGGIFSSLILDIGVLVALYYGITGIACTWAFRKVLLTSVTRFVFAGVLPFLGGIFLLFIAYAVVAPNSLPFGQSLSWAASLPILITVGLGVPLLVVAMASNSTGFFREKTVSYVLIKDQLMASIGGARPVELAVAAVGVGPVVDPTDQSRSRNP
jgi:amino acid transporter